MALNGITFDLRTATAKDDGVFHKALTGKDGILYGCDLSYSGLNLTIGPGWFIVAGRMVQIDENLTLPIASEEDQYARLRFKIDLSVAASGSEFTQGTFAWDLSVPGTFDPLVQEDIYNGGDVYEIEFCVVQIASNLITNITRQIGRIHSTNTRVVYAVLDDASWVGSSAPYTQTVSVSDLAADDIATVGLAMTADATQITEAQSASLLVTGQDDGEITVSAFGTKPAEDIPIQIVIAG